MEYTVFNIIKISIFQVQDNKKKTFVVDVVNVNENLNVIAHLEREAFQIKPAFLSKSCDNSYLHGQLLPLHIQLDTNDLPVKK